MDKLNLGIGDRIAFFRKKKGWLQEDLAKLLAIDRSTLAKYEGNKRELGIFQLAKIANALEVNLADLISDSLLHNENISKELESLKNENASLKKELTDKTKIIDLYEQNIENYKKLLQQIRQQ